MNTKLIGQKMGWKRRLYSSAIMVMLCALIIPTGAAGAVEKSDIGLTAASKTIVVDINGSGQFKSVQSAIDSIPTGGKTHYTLQIKKGTYYEKILIPSSKPNISFVGEGPGKTILTYNHSASTGGGTTNSSSTMIRGNDFHAENLTFSNTAGRNAGQAVALYVASDRATFRNVHMLGFQDTLYAHSGRQYYENCYIEGTVDFIFGGATAVFQKSEIKSLGDGYVTAASTDAGLKYGYVFIDCKLTQPSGKAYKVYLGRPWRPYSSVLFMNSSMDSHIRPEGWHNWGDAANEKTARYSEFNNRGAGWDKRARVKWSKTLTSQQAAGINAKSVLAGSDGWNPQQ